MRTDERTLYNSAGHAQVFKGVVVRLIFTGGYFGIGIELSPGNSPAFGKNVLRVSGNWTGQSGGNS